MSVPNLYQLASDIYLRYASDHIINGAVATADAEKVAQECIEFARRFSKAAAADVLKQPPTS